MIKKLRLKLILASMLSMLIVLTIIMTVINVLNFNSVCAYADNVLTLLAENNGRFPKDDRFEPDGDRDGAHDRSDLPFFGGGFQKGDKFFAELPYESRYFWVAFDDGGGIIGTDTGKIAAVDADAAEKMAAEVFSSGSEKGFSGDYRYAVAKMRAPDGTDGYRVLFLDCSKNLSTYRGFLVTSITVSFAGLCAVFLLIFVFSGRIIRPIAESYAKQKRFISDAGHEIKTPITIIDADAGVLEMELENNEWLKDIQYQAKRLAELTNDLIFLSKMEEQAHSEEMSIEFPLSDIAAETAHSFELMAKSKNKDFNTDIKPMLSFKGQEKAIRQLINILLDNAVKYSDDGGSISFTLDSAGKNIKLCVYNTAENIDKDSLPHLFERFYRADKSRSTGGGYGIGLSVAQAIVTAHKGRISASSADGHSLTVSVSLPLN